jgi:hypothetical protein
MRLCFHLEFIDDQCARHLILSYQYRTFPEPGETYRIAFLIEFRRIDKLLIGSLINFEVTKWLSYGCLFDSGQEWHYLRQLTDCYSNAITLRFIVCHFDQKPNCILFLILKKEHFLVLLCRTSNVSWASDLCHGHLICVMDIWSVSWTSDLSHRLALDRSHYEKNWDPEIPTGTCCRVNNF